jgi:hypothetical protein
MLQKICRVSVLALIISLLPSNVQVANPTEILWNPGVSNGSSSASSLGLVPGAKIRTTGLLVYKSNPDELIMKIIMNDSFEDEPFSGKGRNFAMWIYWPRDGCWSKDKANCAGLFTVPVPVNPASYPSTKSSEYVFVQKHDKASNVNVTATACKAPWWIESNFKSRDTWAFAVSITCLGIPKEFGWYAFSQIDLGQKEVVSDFTQIQTITYPFHDLAAGAAKNNNSTLSSQNNKQLCVLATTGQGYTEVRNLEEQCSGSNSQWEYTYCDSSTKADLEIYKNKKWQKIRSINGTKGNCDGGYEFMFKSPTIGNYRIKNHGSAKFSNSYLNLKIYRKNVT